MDLELSGKTVLVSGGSRGIGLAIAKQFAREGCRVAISARQLDDLKAAGAEVGDDCWTYQADAAEAAACAALMARMRETWGRLDILVTCAGSGASVPLGQETAAEWQRIIELNLFSATNMITQATPLLTASAPAAIICVSSICGREAIGAPVAYSAAKSALDATVKALSRPMGRSGVRINAVSPGNIYFAGGTWDRKQRETPQAVQEMLAREVPLGCFGTPESIADAVCFLASSRASFITGANLVVDGGQTRAV